MSSSSRWPTSERPPASANVRRRRAFFPDETLACTPDASSGGGAAAAAAAADNLRACIDADAEQSRFGIYNESAVARDKRGFDIGQYAPGKARKRSREHDYSRANETRIDAGGADPCFTSTGDAYYDDVHATRCEFQAREATVTDAERARLKEGLGRVAKLAHARRTAGSNAAAYADTSMAQPGETLADYMERAHALDAAAAAAAGGAGATDATDVEWAMSGVRNKREYLASKGDAGDSGAASAAAAATSDGGDGDYVHTYATVEPSADDWMNKHRAPGGASGGAAGGGFAKGGGGGTGALDADDDDGGGAAAPVDHRMPIRIARSEIRQMQALTARLYGKPVSEDEYVDTVRRRFEKMTRGGADGDDDDGGVRLGDDDDDAVMDRNDVVAAAGGDAEVEGRGDCVESYTSDWRNTKRADAHTTLLPAVDWGRTVYARTADAECALGIDPYAFLTSTASRERLVDDIGTHTQFECAVRELRFSCTSAEQRTYDSIKVWAACIATCDVVFRTCVFYTVAPAVARASSHRRRMVICHDLKNGYFACTHFAIVPREGRDDGGGGGVADDAPRREIFSDSYLRRAADRTVSTRHRYMWLSCCYLEYLDTGETKESAAAAAAAKSASATTTTTTTVRTKKKAVQSKAK